MLISMNSVIDKIYDTGYVEDSEGNSVKAFPTSIDYGVGRALYEIVQRTKARNTLEIGMAYGLSALFICQAHHDNGEGRHTAVDPGERSYWKSIGLLNIQRASLEKNFRFYELPAHEILPQLLSQKEYFDLIFIDGAHLFDYTLVDFFYADKLLSSNGYVILHDLWMPSVRKVLAFVLRNKNYELLPEFWQKKYSSWKNLLFLYPMLLFLKFKLTKYFPNYCVLKKVSCDNRKWTHYKPF